MSSTAATFVLLNGSLTPRFLPSSLITFRFGFSPASTLAMYSLAFVVASSRLILAASAAAAASASAFSLAVSVSGAAPTIALPALSVIGASRSISSGVGGVTVRCLVCCSVVN